MSGKGLTLRLRAAVGAAAGLAVILIAVRGFHSSHPSSPPRAVASVSCQQCHPAEYAAWRDSHHALAERLIIPSLDQAAFVPPHFFQAGLATNEATRTNGQYQIVTAGFSTNLEPYPVERAIGVEPVRQYLTPIANGRWQAQEDAYDPLSNVWFDVFGNENRRPGEWGHWTGRGMNWNSTCAECHNTGLRKNYDVATDSYHTEMDEMGVGCAQCHAGMAEHLQWQQQHAGGKEKDPTLARPSPAQIVSDCGSCHSRREDLTGNFSPGKSFFDEYQMQILDESDAWYADGQVHGEDYELASFFSSKMSQRGVICIDCHNPHSGRTILPGNALCLRCHNGSYTNAPVIQPLEHSHHGAASTGNLCVNCHMPVTMFMQRHARRDHGFTIPDPLLTRESGIPNACNRCHADKDAGWALASVKKWYDQKMERHTRERARWIAAAQEGEESAREHLIDMLAPGKESFYWRAVAAGLLWRWPDDPSATAALIRAAQDEHPLVREKAVDSLQTSVDSGGADAIAAANRLLDDRSRNVRVAAAWTLRATLDTNSLAARDLETMLDFNSDQPVGLFRKAQFLLARKDPVKALGLLREVVTWDPYSPPFRFELADVLTALGSTNEALQQLQEICRLQPKSADAQFKLGLALADAQQIQPAIAAFRQTVKLDPENTMAWYNIGLASIAIGQVEESLTALDRAAALSPNDPQIPYERARTLERAGRFNEARADAQKALKLQPEFRPALDLLERIPEQ